MKSSHMRNRLFHLMAIPLAAITLAPISLGTGEMMLFAAMPPRPAAGQQAPSGSSAEALHLLVGRSLVISSQARINRVSVAAPNIVDALVVSPTQILINGKGAGVGSLVIWDETGQNQTFDVYVDVDVSELSAKIHQVFPSEPVQAEARGGVITLSG